jgi:hypothetical protein
MLLSSKVVGEDCWQEKLQNEAKELSIQLVGDSSTNQLEERE